jgi:hypothetical protein
MCSNPSRKNAGCCSTPHNIQHYYLPIRHVEIAIGIATGQILRVLVGIRLHITIGILLILTVLLILLTLVLILVLHRKRGKRNNKSGEAISTICERTWSVCSYATDVLPLSVLHVCLLCSCELCPVCCG